MIKSKKAPVETEVKSTDNKEIKDDDKANDENTETFIQKFMRWIFGDKDKEDEADNSPEEKSITKTLVNEAQQTENRPEVSNPRGFTRSPGKDHNLGQLHFGLRFYVQRDVLKIFLQKGTLLRPIDPDEKIFPHVTVHFVPEFIRFTTTKGKGESGCLWHEVFVITKFRNSRLKYSKLVFTIYNQPSLASGTSILGIVEFDLVKLYAPLKKEDSEECSRESHYSVELEKCDWQRNSETIAEESEEERDYTFENWLNDLDPNLEPPMVCQYPDDVFDAPTEEDDREVDDSASIRATDEYKAKVRKRSKKEIEQLKKKIEETEKLDFRRKSVNHGCMMEGNSDLLDHENSVKEEEQFEDYFPLTERPPCVRKLHAIRHVAAFPNTRPFFGDLMIGLSYHAATFTILVEIVKGHDFRDEKGSAMDLCVAVRGEILKGRKRTTKVETTKVVNGGIDPVWNFPYHFILPHGNPEALGINVKVIAVRSVQANKVLGHLNFSFTSYPKQNEHWRQMFKTSPNRVYRWHPIRV